MDSIKLEDMNVDNLQIEDNGISIKLEPVKSIMELGLIIYRCPVAFNRLQRWLWKICFGVEVNNTKEAK